jgi:hypothetical protein
MRAIAKYSQIVNNRTSKKYEFRSFKTFKAKREAIEKKASTIAYTKKAFKAFVLSFLKKTAQKIKGKISEMKVV